jgi:lysophospholipase L1-like esterase
MDLISTWKKFFLILFCLIILAGCGGGSSGSVTASGGGSTTDASVTQQKIIFAGDSAAGRGNWSSYFGFPIENKGIDGLESSQLASMIEGFVASKPNKIFITIGGNNVFNRREGSVAGDVDMIIARIRLVSPDTQIFFHSILPVKFNDMNGTIEVCNSLIQAVCNMRGVRFISIYGLFKSPTTVINTKYYTPDGIHLNEAGYQLWANTIRPLIFS